jgi:hypothetical protein
MIKGIPRNLIPAVLDEKSERMDLVEYRQKMAGQLSGG